MNGLREWSVRTLGRKQATRIAPEATRRLKHPSTEGDFRRRARQRTRRSEWTPSGRAYKKFGAASPNRGNPYHRRTAGRARTRTCLRGRLSGWRPRVREQRFGSSRHRRKSSESNSCRLALLRCQLMIRLGGKLCRRPRACQCNPQVHSSRLEEFWRPRPRASLTLLYLSLHATSPGARAQAMPMGALQF